MDGVGGIEGRVVGMNEPFVTGVFMVRPRALSFRLEGGGGLTNDAEADTNVVDSSVASADIGSEAVDTARPSEGPGDVLTARFFRLRGRRIALGWILESVNVADGRGFILLAAPEKR